VCLPHAPASMMAQRSTNAAQRGAALLQAVELSKLDLSHNLIAHLPEQLWNLSALATLLLR